MQTTHCQDQNHQGYPPHTCETQASKQRGGELINHRTESVERWLRIQPRAYLLLCAQNEGGRAILAIRGSSQPSTAYYFAREAARYARVLIDREGA